MRKLIALLTIFSFNAYAVAPTGVGGEDGALSYTNNLKAPAYTITSLGGVNSRIESGNTNLLMNPSFEHTAVATGYTGSNFTATADTTNQVEGKKAISLAISGGTLGFGQSSSINAANLVGLQGVVSVKIKTSLTDVKVCPMNAGTEVSSLCVNVTSNNSWKHVVIPFILSATSNGFKVKTTSSTSGTVIIDDAFVGTSQPFQSVNGAKLVGTCTISPSVDQTQTSASFAVFPAVGAIGATLTGSALAPSTNITGCRFSSLLAGDYFVTFDGGFGNGSAGQSSQFTMYDGTTIANEYVYITGASGFGGNTFTTRFTYTTSQTNITFQPMARLIGSGTNYIISRPQTIKVFYFPPESKIYSQASQDYDWTAYTPTSPNSSLTISSSNCYHKREGSDLLVDCKFSGSGQQPSEMRIALPNSLTTSSSQYATSKICGKWTRAETATNTTKSGGVICQNGVSYLTFGIDEYVPISNPFTALNANAIFSTTQDFHISARLQIQGWSDYGVIVGSFAGLEKCANDYECTDTFSAQVSATGVVSNENIDWINGNCTVASPSVCTLNTNLKDGTSGLSTPMNCVVSGGNGGNRIFFVSNSTTSAVSIQDVVMLTNINVALDTPFQLKCQKGSQDYKPKTAKIASSNGVPTVPGLTGSSAVSVDTFSVSYAGSNAGTPSMTNCSSSPCQIDQIGNIVTSVTRGGLGNYTLNLNKTYSTLKCSGSSTQIGVAYVAMASMNCKACSSVGFGTGAGVDTAGDIICQGTY